MKNSDIDLKVRQQLKEKWNLLDANGHSMKIQLRLVTNDSERDKTLAVDVVQAIDEDVIVETVQRRKDEACATLGIAELSAEDLKDVYEEMIAQLHARLGNQHVM